jgi:rubrerythrin
MTSLFGHVRRWFHGSTVVYECRNCGTTLDGREADCPACGSTATACYEVE